MPRATELISQVAGATGLTYDEVWRHARYLREDDLFVRETKSPKSWRVGTRDAANLLASIISGEPAVRAAAAVRRMQEAQLDKDGTSTLENYFQWAPGELRSEFSHRRGFIDAIEGLVTFIGKVHSSFSNDFRNTIVSYEMLSNRGEIELRGITDFSGSNPIIKDKLAHLWYFDELNEFAGDLAHSRHIGWDTLKAAARALRDA